jgi:hypothetical protein
MVTVNIDTDKERKQWESKEAARVENSERDWILCQKQSGEWDCESAELGPEL